MLLGQYRLAERTLANVTVNAKTSSPLLGLGFRVPDSPPLPGNAVGRGDAKRIYDSHLRE